MRSQWQRRGVAELVFAAWTAVGPFAVVGGGGGGGVLLLGRPNVVSLAPSAVVGVFAEFPSDLSTSAWIMAVV